MTLTSPSAYDLLFGNALIILSTKKSKTSLSCKTSAVFRQTPPSIIYLSLFLKGLCSPLFGTLYKLSINGSTSSIFVSGIEIYGFPVKGSGNYI